MRFNSEYWRDVKQPCESLKTGNEELRNGQGRIRALNYCYGYRGCSFVSYLVQRVAGLQPDEMAAILCIRWSVKTTL